MAGAHIVGDLRRPFVLREALGQGSDARHETTVAQVESIGACVEQAPTQFGEWHGGLSG